MWHRLCARTHTSLDVDAGQNSLRLTCVELGSSLPFFCLYSLLRFSLSFFIFNLLDCVL